MGGVSAIIPNCDGLPMADIANHSRHFFCRASWDPDISSQVAAAGELESSVEAHPSFPTLSTLSGTLGSCKTKEKVDTPTGYLEFFSPMCPMVLGADSVAPSGACLRGKVPSTLGEVNFYLVFSPPLPTIPPLLPKQPTAHKELFGL